jgi:hypothetical protein
MTTKLTPTKLLALNPCDADKRLALFGKHKSLTAIQALKAGFSISNILWVAGKLDRKDLCVRYALAVAKRVAHLNPDPRVQAALDATQAWLDNPSNAAYTAYTAYTAAADAAATDAAYTAYTARSAAAYAATYAADAATYAARSAARSADAADAAYAATYAADAATYAATYADARTTEEEEQRKLFLTIFKDA